MRFSVALAYFAVAIRSSQGYKYHHDENYEAAMMNSVREKKTLYLSPNGGSGTLTQSDHRDKEPMDDNGAFWERFLQSSGSSLPPAPDIRIESITFAYFCIEDETCVSSSDNTQSGFVCKDSSSCRDDGDVLVVAKESGGGEFYSGVIADGGNFTVYKPEKTLNIDIYRFLLPESSRRNLDAAVVDERRAQEKSGKEDLIQNMEIRTSCSNDDMLLHVGDRFGLLHVVDIRINEDIPLSSAVTESNAKPTCSCTSSKNVAEWTGACDEFLQTVKALQLAKTAKSGKATKAPKTFKSTNAPRKAKSTNAPRKARFMKGTRGREGKKG